MVWCMIISKNKTKKINSKSSLFGCFIYVISSLVCIYFFPNTEMLMYFFGFCFKSLISSFSELEVFVKLL